MSSVEFALDDGSILSFATDKRSYSTDPEVYAIQGVLTAEECEHFIKVAKPHLTRQTFKMSLL